MFEVGLTAPQIELDDGTIIMFWYDDQKVRAMTKSEAKNKVRKMIRLDKIDYRLVDEDGDPIKMDFKWDFDTPSPEIEWVDRI